MALSDGRGGKGFLICNRCGYGEPGAGERSKSHQSPVTGRACRGGSLELLSLAHRYQTDVLELRIEGEAVSGLRGDPWFSVLYAIVQGASEALEISRDDIDGTVFATEAGGTALMLFDTVPGGAGHVRRIAENLPAALDRAARIAGECECGPETSCYRCLRVYRNQRHHENLRRGVAAEVLARLTGAEPPTSTGLPVLTPEQVGAATGRFALTTLPGTVFEAVTRVPLDRYEGRLVVATIEGVAVAGRLWLRRDETGVTEAAINSRSATSHPTDPSAVRVLAVAVS